MGGPCQRRGIRGIEYGGKPHILDWMGILKEVGDGDESKYITREVILHW